MNKPFKHGVYLGRFQPIHLGHKYIIDKALELCDRVTIVIGSAQEHNTERNPFDCSLRKTLIASMYENEIKNGQIKIIGLNDRTSYSDDSSWGEYLMDHVYKHTNSIPDVIIGGYEKVRNNWFDKNSLYSQVIISRDIVMVQATDIRNALIDDEDEYFYDATDPKIHRYKDCLKKILKGLK